jgi:uncharacterized membrane protein
MNNLSGRSLWTDEFFTLFQSTGHGVAIKNLLDEFSKSQSPKLLKAQDFKAFLKNDPAKDIKDVSRGLLDTDTHPPLYFWIIFAWIRLFGDSLFAVRFFSVLMGVLAILLAHRIGSYLFNQRVANFCALFTSISAFSIRYSQEARAYSLIIVIGLLSSLFALRLEKDNKNSDAFWFAIFNALGLYAHYFYSFVAVAQFIYFSVVHIRDSLKIKKFYLAVLCSLLLFSPWCALVILKGYNFRNAEWIFGYPGIINKIGYLCLGISRYILIFDGSGILPGLFLLIGLSLFVYIILCGGREVIAKYRRQFFFCLSICLFPLLAMFFIDIIQHGALLRQERFWMFSFLGFLPLAGYFLSLGFLKNKLITSLLILLMLVSALLVVKLQFGPAPEHISLWINKESQRKSSLVIVYNIRSAVFAQSYYLDNDIYLLPVSDNKQLSNAVKVASGLVDKIFIVRHYHRTDASLMNQLFMETKEIGAGFKLKASVNKDDISISEFVKCAL